MTDAHHTDRRSAPDYRTMIPKAEAIMAAEQAAAMAATLTEERIRVAAEAALADPDPHGIGNLDGVKLLPNGPTAIATFGGWTIRSYPDGWYDATSEAGLTTGYRNVVDLISDLRSGHYSS